MSNIQGSYNIDDDDAPRWSAETELLASFRYDNYDGTFLFYNDKGLNPDGRKPYRPRRLNMLRHSHRLEAWQKPDTLFHLRDVPRPLPLYSAPSLVDPKRQHETVFITEGERDADTLIGHGLLATTNYGGARKWARAYSEVLRDRDCVVLPDNDPSGRQHATQIMRLSHGIFGRLRILPLPGLLEKGDVTDWFAAGSTVADLFHLVATAAIEVRSV